MGVAMGQEAAEAAVPEAAAGGVVATTGVMGMVGAGGDGSMMGTRPPTLQWTRRMKRRRPKPQSSF